MEKIEAIVFKQIEYRENDFIISLLTSDNKRFSLCLKGAKKPNNKSYVYGIIGNTYEYSIKDDNSSFVNFIAGSIVTSRNKITNSLVKIAIMNMMMEIIDKLTMEEVSYEHLYTLLSFCLDKLNNDDHEFITLALFICLIYKELGIEPAVDGCVVCDNKHINALDIKNGGFVCSDHHQGMLYYHNDINSLRKFRYLNKAMLNDHDKLAKIIEVDIKDIEILVNFLQLHSGIKLNSFEFLESII